jgi:hypothetical protein
MDERGCRRNDTYEKISGKTTAMRMENKGIGKMRHQETA